MDDERQKAAERMSWIKSIEQEDHVREIASQATAVQNYIEQDECLQKELSNTEGAMIYHDGNMGMILVDAVAQAGIEYSGVSQALEEEEKIARKMDYDYVMRVVEEVEKFGCRTVTEVRDNKEKFMALLDKDGTRISEEKRSEFSDLIRVIPQGKETAEDIKEWLSEESEMKNLLEILHVGKKTADYLYQRCGGDIICVDIHIIDYIEKAIKAARADLFYPYAHYPGREPYHYPAQMAITWAAEELEISPRQLDFAIWSMMRKNKGEPDDEYY